MFAGLVPELENQIQEKLDPLLRDALLKTKSTYESIAGHDPDSAQLFQLVFWLLTAKVCSTTAKSGSSPTSKLIPTLTKFLRRSPNNTKSHSPDC